MSVSNPNGANQYLSDPRQKMCWDLYVNPSSETFGNAYRSALRAGYEENTAAVITIQDWFKERLRRLNMLNKAEKVLEKCLDQKKDMRLAQDTGKFIAKTLGKEYYSERTEHTGKDGESLVLEISEAIAKRNNLGSDSNSEPEHNS